MAMDLLGWVAASFTLITFAMRTMLPLRIAALGSNIFFIAYGATGELYPILVLHVLLLPFNLYRLRELLKTRQAITRARSGPIDPKWFRGMSIRRQLKAGEVVFRKGDPPDFLYYIVSGRIALEGIDTELGAGDVLGEIAFFTDARARTLTARATEDSELLALDEAGFTRLHFQDPSFGLYLMRTITQRLMDGMGRKPNPYHGPTE